MSIRLRIFLGLWACTAVAQPPVPSEYEKDLAEAQKLFGQGDLAGVIRKLTPWPEKEPKRPEADHGLGLAYYQQQNFVEAIRHLSVALKLEKENSAAWRQTVETLAMAYYFSSRAAEALPLLEKAAAWSPGNSDLHYTLAMAYLYTRDRDGARRTFAKLFGVPGDSAQAYLLAADLMLQESHGEEAEQLILEARKKRPDLPEARYRLGLIALEKGAYLEAIQHLEAELAANPGLTLAWQYLGDAYLRLGKPERAVEPLQRALWLNRRSARSYILLANAYTQQGRFFVAEHALKRALQLDPQNYEAHFLLARVYQKTNRQELAKEELATAEKLRSAGERQP